MKILIITQDEPFFLKQNLEYLFSILHPDIIVAGCVVSKVSPFGKKESFLRKSFKTIKIFGLRFFIHYSIEYVRSFFLNKSVKSLLVEKNIPLIDIEGSINNRENISILKSYDPSLLVSILGNQIFKKPLLELAPMGCINLHTALLPKYRGLMPTFWVLKNNETHTGVSVFFVDEGIDSGPIIVQKKIKIANSTQKELIIKTKRIGMELIAQSINLIKNNDVNLIPNPKSEMTYFSFPKREDVEHFLKSGKRFF